MSPEQARGNDVDKRADLWAFGVVLWEMLTGTRLFEGATVSDTLAAVLKTEPPWSALAPATPPAIRRLLRRCLEKDRKRRLDSAAAARLEIEDALTAPAAVLQDDANERGAAAAARSRGRERLAWGLAGVLLVSTLALGAAWSRSGDASASRPAPEMRVEIATPQRAAEVATFTLSPDGTRLAFTFGGQVWVRPLESENAQALAGTDGVTNSGTGSLFWSPDGESIGFGAQGQLKRVDLRSGLARSLAAAPNVIGGTWAPDGTILFVPSPASPVIRISGGGGDGVPATTLAAGQVGHRFPQFLPDGRHFIFLAVGTKETRGIYVGSLDAPDTRRLLESDSRAVFSPPDALLYMRQGALEARRLNLDTLSLEGDARPVASRVFVSTNNFNNIAMSGAAGLLAYRSHGGVARLMWVDRAGRRLSEVGEPDAARPNNIHGSPTENLVAMQRTVDGNVDVWVLDTERGVQRRLTFGDERDNAPAWSPDGRRIVFSSERAGVFDLFERPTDGSGRETALLSSSEPKFVDDWSPDGRNLLFNVQSTEGGRDVWVLPLDGDRKPLQLTRTPFSESEGRFSPDGRWVAYQSNETGRMEIYVQSFPDLKMKVQVSARGGAIPFWRRDGRELFYEAPDERIMAVPIELSAITARPGAPVALFQRTGNWESSPDGQRFLMVEETEPPAPITLLLNWAGLPR
jgi:Tol biopolymer transport system component